MKIKLISLLLLSLFFYGCASLKETIGIVSFNDNKNSRLSLLEKYSFNTFSQKETLVFSGQLIDEQRQPITEKEISFTLFSDKRTRSEIESGYSRIDTISLLRTTKTDKNGFFSIEIQKDVVTSLSDKILVSFEEFTMNKESAKNIDNAFTEGNDIMLYTPIAVLCEIKWKGYMSQNRLNSVKINNVTQSFSKIRVVHKEPSKESAKDIDYVRELPYDELEIMFTNPVFIEDDTTSSNVIKLTKENFSAEYNRELKKLKENMEANYKAKIVAEEKTENEQRLKEKAKEATLREQYKDIRKNIAIKNFAPTEANEELIFKAFKYGGDGVQGLLRVEDGKTVYLPMTVYEVCSGNFILLRFDRNIIIMGLLKDTCVKRNFYDGQVVLVAGTIMGTKSYPTQNGTNKTVPAINIWAIKSLY